MVFDGNTEICAHVQSKIDHLICLHVGNSVKYENIFTKGPVFMFLASIWYKFHSKKQMYIMYGSCPWPW